LCDYFLHLRDTDPKWKGVISEAFYPVQDYVTMGKKSLSNKPRPMTPGVIYLKTKMDPDIADDIELVKGIYGLVKSANRLVLPITEEEGKMLESLLEKAMNANTLDPQFAELKRDEYVEIISGPWAGRYGILQGVRLGKLEVCLRSNYKDDFDTFDLHEVRYLANPPVSTRCAHLAACHARRLTWSSPTHLRALLVRVPGTKSQRDVGAGGGAVAHGEGQAQPHHQGTQAGGLVGGHFVPGREVHGPAA
jgi:transcription antitermination factor NusG